MGIRGRGDEMGEAEMMTRVAAWLACGGGGGRGSYFDDMSFCCCLSSSLHSVSGGHIRVVSHDYETSFDGR